MFFFMVVVVKMIRFVLGFALKAYFLQQIMKILWTEYTTPMIITSTKVVDCPLYSDSLTFRVFNAGFNLFGLIQFL